MNKSSISIWIIILSSMLSFRPSIAQSTAFSMGEWVDSVLYEIRSNQSLDAKSKSLMADSAFQVSRAEKDICRQVYSRVIQALSLDQMGMADSALTQLYWARSSFQQGCDSTILFYLYANLTNVFLTLGELDRIDSVGHLALASWNPLWKDKEVRFMILNNLAIAQVYKGDTLTGTNTFRLIYQEANAIQDTRNIQSSLINLGTIKGMVQDYDSAYYFFSVAAKTASPDKDIVSYLDLQYNLATIEMDRKNYTAARKQLDTLYAIAEKHNYVQVKANVQLARSILYTKLNDFKKAYAFQREYIALNNEVLNEERIKAVTDMMEKYESEKKARQIQELQVANLDANLKHEKTKNTRNRYLYSGIGVVLFSIGLWTRLRHIRRSREAIKAEKDISEGLLLNILPAPVAEELKINGKARAKLFPDTTILFSDFKGFTEISGDMDPADLVDELNTCFQAFDEITSQYGLEKIKTIGDAYMAAGSIPETNNATASDVLHAALAMQQFIASHKKEREAINQPSFEMRIGIHSGPVVAGIVGVKKFQYDLWGDTVNIASRMETNGEPGRINISASTYELVKNDPSFVFTPRGMINVKGKGDLLMYFADAAPSV